MPPQGEGASSRARHRPVRGPPPDQAPNDDSNFPVLDPTTQKGHQTHRHDRLDNRHHQIAFIQRIYATNQKEDDQHELFSAAPKGAAGHAWKIVLRLCRHAFGPEG